MQYVKVIGLQEPPESGYSEEYFASLIDQMQRQFEVLTLQKDPRAVFQLTYLTFSKHVYENLKRGTFADQEWATDMCCRFVEIYLLQMRLWEEKSPHQCSTWRDALELMEKGKLNVLQCMFLGMNAHINYDLAFCTLGACVAQGDISLNQEKSKSEVHNPAALQSRYLDYLQINHVGWRSITHIQDEVLNRFHPILGVFNRWLTSISKPLSVRVLMASRDQAWRRTALLVHSTTPEETKAIAKLIDYAALRWANAIQTISMNPLFAHRAIRKWQSGNDVSKEPFFNLLLNVLGRNSLSSHLLMAELAFAGASSVLLLEEFMEKRQFKKAKQWASHICENGTTGQFETLIAHLSKDLQRHAAIIMQLRINSRTAKQRMKPLLQLKNKAIQIRKKILLQYAKEPALQTEEHLALGIQSELHYIHHTLEMQHSKTAIPQPLLKAMSEDTNPWLAYLAQGIITHLGGTLSEEPIVESVLFLKDSLIFSSVQTEYLYELSKHLESRRYAAGDYIIRMGDAPQGIWFIKSGRVSICGENEKTIAQFTSYDVLGELSCIGGIPATASAIAEEPTLAYFIRSSDFISALHDVPEIAINLMQIMVKRLSATSHSLMSIA